MLWGLIKKSPDGKSFDIQTNSLNQFIKEMYGGQSGESVFAWILGLRVQISKVVKSDSNLVETSKDIALLSRWILHMFVLWGASLFPPLHKHL